MFSRHNFRRSFTCKITSARISFYGLQLPFWVENITTFLWNGAIEHTDNFEINFVITSCHDAIKISKTKNVFKLSPKKLCSKFVKIISIILKIIVLYKFLRIFRTAFLGDIFNSIFVLFTLKLYWNFDFSIWFILLNANLHF